MATRTTAFGLMFELPLLVLALAAVGIIRIDLLARQRPVAAVVILVLAALLTPPDVISQLMLGLPVYLLFELTILLGRVLIKQTAADDPGGDNTAANHSTEDTTASTVDDLTDCENDFMSNCYVRRKKIRIRRPEKFMPRKTGKHIDGRW